MVPINALSATHIEEVTAKAVIDEVASGRYVFRKGDRDYKSVYLLEGQVELLDGREVVGKVTAGSDAARHPLAHKQPRQLSVRASGRVTVARVDSSLLDVLLTWDESSGYDVVEIEAEDDDDWMTRMLQSRAFVQLPPASIHQLLMRLEAVTAKAGDIIVNQGEEGDYFYIVKSGHLAVTRKASSRSKEVLLAELDQGDCFGEDALVSGTQRNATVRMVTDGSLMRLSKTDFDELLRVSLVHEVDYAQASEMVAAGARWLDVRLPGEFANQAIEGSINMPLSALRDAGNELDSDQAWIVYCDTGRRSSAGAFVLGQYGYTVHVLRNGLENVPDEVLTGDRPGASATAAQDAEIIPFDAGADPEKGVDREDEVAVASPVSGSDGQAGLQQRIQEQQRQIEELTELGASAAEEKARLQEQVAELEASLAEARQADGSRQKELLEQNRELTTELDGLRVSLREVDQRINALERERDSAAMELRQARQEVDTLNEQLTAQESESGDELESVRRELKARDQALAEEQAQREAAEKARADLEARLQAAEQQAGEATEQQDALKAEHEQALAALREELEQSLQAAVTEKAGLDEQVATLQAEIERLQQEASTGQAELGEQVERLQAENERLQQEAEAGQGELGEQLSALQAQLEEQSQQLAEQTALREQLQAQLEAAEQQAGEATEQQDALKAEHEQALAALREELEASLAEARKQQQAAERQVSELQASLEKSAREHESDISSVRDALARAQNERENIKREQARLTESLRDAETRLENERHDHEAEVHRLRKELQEAEAGGESGMAAELEAMQEQLDEAHRNREELELKLGERSTQLERHRTQVADLELLLEQARNRVREIEQTVVSVESGREALQQTLEAERQRLDELAGSLEETIAERDRTRESLTVQEQELEDLRAALQQMQEAERNGSRDLEQARQEADRELQSLKETLAAAQAERDAALEAQEQARQEADRLQAEAEVARGLVDMQAPAGEPDGRLREELEEVRKNIEVAVRLRSQAEDRARALADEVEQLRAQLKIAPASGAGPVLRVPSLDADDPDATVEMDTALAELPDIDEPQAAAPVAAPLLGEEAADGGESAGRSGSGAWKAALAGLVVTGAAAFAAFWWFGGEQGERVETVVSESPVATVAPDGPAPATPSAATAVPAEAPRPGVQRTADEPSQPAPEPEPERATAPAVSPFSRGEPLAGPPGEERASVSAPQADTGPLPETEPEPEEVPAPRVAQPGRRFSDPLADGGTGPRLVQLNADRYQMGSSQTSANFDERPRHEVTLERFAIGQYEVTFDDYDRYARATGRSLPPDEGWGRGSRPVINVSWQDAVDYTRWLSEQTGHRYRLPTEAEWEFAARSGSDRRFWWGNELDEGDANCFDCGNPDAGARTVAVGSFAPSDWSLYDMAGNVMEWVQDCYQPDYSDVPLDGSAVDAPACTSRVVRGGGFTSPGEELRSASRNRRAADSALDNLGFRVVREF